MRPVIILVATLLFGCEQMEQEESANQAAWFKERAAACVQEATSEAQEFDYATRDGKKRCRMLLWLGSERCDFHTTAKLTTLWCEDAQSESSSCEGAE